MRCRFEQRPDHQRRHPDVAVCASALPPPLMMTMMRRPVTAHRSRQNAAKMSAAGATSATGGAGRVPGHRRVRTPFKELPFRDLLLPALVADCMHVQQFVADVSIFIVRG